MAYTGSGDNNGNRPARASNTSNGSNGSNDDEGSKKYKKSGNMEQLALFMTIIVLLEIMYVLKMNDWSYVCFPIINFLTAILLVVGSSCRSGLCLILALINFITKTIFIFIFFMTKIFSPVHTMIFKFFGLTLDSSYPFSSNSWNPQSALYGKYLVNDYYNRDKMNIYQCLMGADIMGVFLIYSAYFGLIAGYIILISFWPTGTVWICNEIDEVLKFNNGEQKNTQKSKKSKRNNNLNNLTQPC